MTRDQSPQWHGLIKEFCNETGVPLLLNTSFNLAGEPLVHTNAGALNSLRGSELDCVYLADRSAVPQVSRPAIR